MRLVLDIESERVSNVLVERATLHGHSVEREILDVLESLPDVLNERELRSLGRRGDSRRFQAALEAMGKVTPDFMQERIQPPLEDRGDIFP